MLYLGKPVVLHSLLVEPSNSLINQSLHSKSIDTPVNGDGFGVAWYVPDITSEPGVFRSLTPAWSNNNLVRLSKVTRSGCVLAHVRAASVGIESAESNCHPFISNQLAFAHNGDVTCFHAIRRRLEDLLSDSAFDLIGGNTDSEHLFGVFTDHLRASHGGATPTGDSLAGALESTIGSVLGLARGMGAEKNDTYINAAVTDGKRAVGCRFSTDTPENTPTLYVHRGGRYVCEDGVCRLLDAAEAEACAVISWEEVPHNHLVLVDEDRTVTMRAMKVA
jgi:predicted glutamine amidotransferase